MGHYDEFEWKLYKEDLLDPDLRQVMEDHLFTCGTCMEEFISLIDDDEIGQASSSVPLNFSQDVMARIGRLVQKPNRPVTSIEERILRTKQRRSTLTNYVTVACLTLVLTATGVFSNPTSNILDLDLDRGGPNIPNRIYNASAHLIWGFSKALNGFNIDNKQ